MLAKNDYLEALKLFHSVNHEDFYVARYVLQPLGNIHTRFGENEQALRMLTKFKEISEENDEVDAIANAYNDIGRVHLNKGDGKKAIESFNSGISIETDNHINIGLLYSSLAEAYLYTTDLKQGINTALKGKDHFSKALKNTDTKSYQFQLIKKYQQETKKTLGNLLSESGDYKSSIYSFNEALRDAKIIYPRKHREIGKIHLGIANCYVKSENIEKGLTHYQDALISMIPNFESLSHFDNPKKEFLYADVTIGEALIGKAKTQKALYDSIGGLNFLKASLETYLTYYNWEKSLRNEHQNDNSKLKFAAINHQIGSEALQIIKELDKIEPLNNWAEAGFKLIDQTKSTVLDQTRRRNINQSRLNLNDSIFDDVRQLEVQLSLLNIEFNDAILAGDSIKQSRINKQIVQSDEKYQILNHTIKQKYWTLSELNSGQTKSIDINSLKEELKKSESTILNYYEGDSNLFVAIINPDKTFLIQLEFNSYNNSVDQFIHAISSDKINGPVQYENISYSLYEAIIEPIQSQLSSKKWIIIPDGKMHQVPFEALIHTKSETKNFKQLNYLLHKQVISYCPSAKFYLTDNKWKKGLKPFLGIAPIFKHNKEFSWLNHSKNEIKLGKTYFGGDLLVAEKATKHNFLEEVEDYQIVHISTHADKGTNANNDGWMAFASDTLSNRLQTPEIFQLNLSSDLVILNACETGVGEIFRGEGTRSITAGFLSSGANNVITNLWQANHSSNLQLFEAFYDNLASETKPSSSLQQAKIKFITNENTNELTAHPYYWAAPILIGTDHPIKVLSSTSSNTIWYIVGGLIFIVILPILRKKRNSQT